MGEAVEYEFDPEPRVDPVTGVPVDYWALAEEYRGMVIAAAARLGVPVADQEDAAQEVELRFFRGGGLAAFDPNKLFEPPPEGWRDGDTRRPGARTARFGGFYRRFVGLHMMQEMDRHNNRLNRVRPVEGGDLPEHEERDFTVALCARDNAREWLEKAEFTLHRAGRSELVPLLDVLVDAPVRDRDGNPKTPARAILGAALGVKGETAGFMLKDLRRILGEYGLGPESLAS